MPEAIPINIVYFCNNNNKYMSVLIKYEGKYGGHLRQKLAEYFIQYI